MSSMAKESPIHTGIFYHPSFSRRSYLTQGSRLQDFPQALKAFLEDDRYRLFESPPIDEEWILKVHTPQLIDGVLQDPLCSTAWHSVGGVVLAAEKIMVREIRNAFAFIGAGGHHSGRNYFGGYCCFNDVVIAMRVLRERLGVSKFAILDTDAHHGDGTRDLVKDDPNILHVCMCSSRYESKDGTKVDVPAPGRPWFFSTPSQTGDVNKLYAEAAAGEFEPRVRIFKPELIFWYFGFDTHQGDYGDIGLTLEAYLLIAQMVKRLAEEVCDGRLEVVLAGGSRSDIARHVIPPVIEILGDREVLNNGSTL
jgi:acetoin utilization deacetylase AcuC-like enzyme